MQQSAHNIVAALDMGTSKVCCAIGGVENDRVTIFGIGHRAAAGMRGGAILDMDAVEACVLAAISAAEQEADIRLERVSLSVNSAALQSWNTEVEISTGMRAVTDADIRRLLNRVVALGDSEGMTLLHTIPAGGYRLDTVHAIHDPRGLHGNRLSVMLHMIAAPTLAVRNLLACLSRCRIEAEMLIAAPFAAGLAAVDEDEAELGVTVIDLGAASTGIAVFHKGSCVYAGALGVGGRYVTQDIASGLSISLVDAERLKAIYGIVWGDENQAEEDEIDIVQIGDSGDEGGVTDRISRALLSGIIRPRVEETLEMVRERLEERDLATIGGMRVVLIGGGSQIAAIRPLSETVFPGQVRLARPRNLYGLAVMPPGPDLAVVAGVMLHTARQRQNVGRPLPGARRGWFGWLRRS